MARTSAPKKWSDAILLPTDSMVYCPWNVNEMSDESFSELVAEIEDHGFDEPLQVIEITEAHTDPDTYPALSKSAVVGNYLVLGGEHRARAAKALEWKTAPCVLKNGLATAGEADLKIWSVKRNNIRGRINAQKYADLERSLSNKHQVRAEAARRRMLVKGEILKRLRKNIAVQDNEEVATPGNGKTVGNGKTAPDSKSDVPGSKFDSRPHTDGARDRQAASSDRRKLLTALQEAERDVLLQSGDTVEHGYLFFGQGDNGQTHLVVNESARLAALVKRMVAACKKESAKIDDFLAGAITAELRNWESK